MKLEPGTKLYCEMTSRLHEIYRGDSFMVEDLVGVENEYIDSQTITGKITRILSRQVFKYTITSVKTGKKFVLSDSDIFIFFTIYFYFYF